MSSSPEGSTRSNSLCTFLGTSLILSSLVSSWMPSVESGDGGQRAWAACACAASRLSSSVVLFLLRFPTLGAIFWGARHVQSHALCWVCSSNAGLGRSLGVLWSARGVECLGSSVSRCTTGVSSLV